MTYILKENSEEIRNKIKEAGIELCGCTEFKDACWLDYTPSVSESVHGVGYYDDGELGINSQEEMLDYFVEDCRFPVWCKDVDEFIDKILHTKGIMGYVARSKDGCLTFFSHMPERDIEEGEWLVPGGA